LSLAILTNSAGILLAKPYVRIAPLSYRWCASRSPSTSSPTRGLEAACLWPSLRSSRSIRDPAMARLTAFSDESRPLRSSAAAGGAAVVRRTESRSMLPIPWSPAGVSDGDDVDVARTDSIGDQVREAPDLELSRWQATAAGRADLRVGFDEAERLDTSSNKRSPQPGRRSSCQRTASASSCDAGSLICRGFTAPARLARFGASLLPRTRAEWHLLRWQRSDAQSPRPRQRRRLDRLGHPSWREFRRPVLPDRLVRAAAHPPEGRSPSSP
jgi:hypothetical protein